MTNTIDNIKIKVKKYLELENVSFLFGAGSSFHLGAPVIRTIPQPLKDQCLDEITRYFGEGADPSYEDLFNCLQADRYLKEMKNVALFVLNTIKSKDLDQYNALLESIGIEETFVQNTVESSLN